MVVGEFTVETDLVVVGGGPGGLSCAMRAAELGIETTLVDDRPRIGGSWLHAGCVRSKELCGLASVIRAAVSAAEWGVRFAAPEVDFQQVSRRLQQTIDAHARELDRRCSEAGLTVVSGRARFESSRQLTILNNTQTPRLHFRRAVIATGSRPRPLPGLSEEDPRITDPSDSLPLPALPARLLVVGGNSTAVEVANAYAALGSRVTIAGAGEMLVPHADRDLVAMLEDALRPLLESLRLDGALVEVRPARDGITARFKTGDGEEEEELFDHVVVAVGRTPNTSDLNLPATRVALDERGFIRVDEQMRSADARILAVGDVVGEPLLARRAAHQGRVAAEAVAGWNTAHDPRAIPMTVFTEPPLAWCGLTEHEAQAAGEPHAVHRVRWNAAGFATTTGNGGASKIIYEPDSKLVLGVGMIGPGAADLIAEAVLAIEMGAVLDDIAELVHPHPGAGESLGVAARGESDGAYTV